MEIKGIISRVGELESLTSKTGTPFFRRNIYLKTVEQFPQSGVFTLSGENAQTFQGQCNQQATVYFNLHTYESQDGTKTFNKLDAWRIETS